MLRTAVPYHFFVSWTW